MLRGERPIDFRQMWNHSSTSTVRQLRTGAPHLAISGGLSRRAYPRSLGDCFSMKGGDRSRTLRNARCPGLFRRRSRPQRSAEARGRAPSASMESRFLRGPRPKKRHCPSSILPGRKSASANSERSRPSPVLRASSCNHYPNTPHLKEGRPSTPITCPVDVGWPGRGCKKGGPSAATPRPGCPTRPSGHVA